jgi:hypothetical protein
MKMAQKTKEGGSKDGVSNNDGSVGEFNDGRAQDHGLNDDGSADGGTNDDFQKACRTDDEWRYRQSPVSHFPAPHDL